MEAPREEDAYRRLVAESGGALLTALSGLEAALSRLHPPRIDSLREALAPAFSRLATAREALERAAPPAGLEDLHRHLAHVVALGGRALEAFLTPTAPAEAAPRILEAMRQHARAQEALYPLRRVFPPVSDFFLEPAARARAGTLAPAEEAESTGIQVAGDPDGRGGFHLYVPESYGEDGGGRAWPLVVALHGGFGHGRDFLWTWLREARSRRFLLLAPTSKDTTWSLMGPDRDGPALRSMLSFVGERWRVDPERVLLTGLSDGATFTLLAGLAEDAPYTALAPVSGVLHPGNFASGNLARAAGRRIYLVHGALDWMFPVALAREAAEILERHGAEVTYRELPEHSHTYPREENARILAWFDPELALP